MTFLSVFILTFINGLKFCFSVGDMIEYQKNLYNIDDEFYYCYRIYIKLDSKDPIIIHNAYYFFNTSPKKLLFLIVAKAS